MDSSSDVTVYLLVGLALFVGCFLIRRIIVPNRQMVRMGKCPACKQWLEIEAGNILPTHTRTDGVVAKDNVAMASLLTSAAVLEEGELPTHPFPIS